jgi:hypothetical protein
MQAKSLLLTTLLIACWAAPLGAAEWRGGGGGWSAGPGGPGPGRPGPGGPGDGRRHGGPDVFVQPYIDLDLSRQSRPNVDAPEFIMAEIGRCANAGVRSFVDCLRPNHGAVMIRRLEDCVQSETIPDDPSRVAACLPPAPVR